MADEVVLQRFEDLIRARSGLNMRAQEAHLLRQTLLARTQVFQYKSAASYLALLESDSALAGQEWKHLFGVLTNQESYFFRDQGQMAVIRDRLLPDLIRKRAATRELRIWSAGSSTGEEAYSLAMILADLLPLRDHWKVSILGTDLSGSAIEKANRGLYGAWSFRMNGSEIQNRFFISRGKNWEVQAELRRSVKFARGNLVEDEFPSNITEIHDMDLILCRNVFIYFSRDAVARVLQKFTRTLQPEGYLVTGHAELHDVSLGELQTRVFPQTVVYQRVRAEHKEKVISPSKTLAAISPTAALSPAIGKKIVSPLPAASGVLRPGVRPVSTVAPAPQATIETTDLIALIHSGQHAAALQKLGPLLAAKPDNLELLSLAAQAQANAGNLEEAAALCRRAIAVSPSAPLPYHVLARVVAEQGEHEAAKTLLKKVIYLNPACVRCYLELVEVHRGEGDAKRAGQMQRSALEILNGLSDESEVPIDEFAAEEPIKVGVLKAHLQENSER